ncbi:MAG: alpha-glucosidase domain-containing protein [Thermoanaerobaculia bacterium]
MPNSARRLRIAALSLLVLVSVLGASAAGAWTPVGAFGPPARDGDTLVFGGESGTVTVGAVGDGVVRVRFTPAGTSPLPRSWAVTGAPPRTTPPAIAPGSDASRVTGGSLTAVVTHAPLRVSFVSGDDTIDADDPLRGMAFSGAAVRVWKRLRDDEHVYGFGEKTGPLDKRGNKLGGVAYAMWNSDTYGYGDDTDPLYASAEKPQFKREREGSSEGSRPGLKGGFARVVEGQG